MSWPSRRTLIALLALALAGCREDSPAYTPSQCPKITCPLSIPKEKPQVDPARLKRPPPRPADALPGDGSRPLVLVLREMRMVSANGEPAGFDIDGQISDLESTYHCCEGPAGDGEGGIDNAFGQDGRSIGEYLVGGANRRAELGELTLLFELPALGSTDDQSPVAGYVHLASAAATPAWNGNDVWNIRAEQVLEGGSPLPVAVFSEGYVNWGRWVGSSSDTLPLPLSDRPAAFRLHLPTLLLDLATLSPSREAATGILSGLFHLWEFQSDYAWAVWAQDGCEHGDRVGSDTLLFPAVRSLADITPAGDQLPGMHCTAISFGAELTLVPAQRGSVLQGEPPVPRSRCTP